MEKNETAALRDVNRIRKDLDLPQLTKLRRGYRRSADQCPISRSIRFGYTKLGLRRLDITNTGFTICRHGADGRADQTWRASNGTRAFTGDFDRGGYSHLVLDGATPNPGGFK